MTFSFLSTLLLATALLSSPRPAGAQTTLGQPTLDEAKVQVWCATIRFVYDDAGRPNLKSTVHCGGGDLAALAASIRPDSLRVFSILYQPIEGKGRIYQGKKDNPARITALTQAIIGKLKSSPARRADPARMARLQALEVALTNYATRGTPPGDVSAAMVPETADTTVAATTPGAPGPAEIAEAEAASHPLTATSPPTTTENLLNRFAAPLALILGVLSLVLYVMLRISLGHWRRQQRRETLVATLAATTAKTAAEAASSDLADALARVKRAEALVLAAAPEAAAAPTLDRLSPEQRLEVERLVSQRVDEELRWLRAQLPELLAAAQASPVTRESAEEPLEPSTEE
jgi:hypothetical protein